MERSLWRHPVVKYTGLAVMGIVVTFSLFFIKVKKESGQEFTRAESNFQSGRQREAVLHYERAIMWYTPFSHEVQRSISRLWEIGDRAEANRDDSLALYAYRSLRASLYSVRSFYQPYEDWIAKCDVRIVNLMAIEKAGSGADPAEIEKHRARYARTHACTQARPGARGRPSDRDRFFWLGRGHLGADLVWVVAPRQLAMATVRVVGQWCGHFFYHMGNRTFTCLKRVGDGRFGDSATYCHAPWRTWAHCFCFLGQ